MAVAMTGCREMPSDIEAPKRSEDRSVTTSESEPTAVAREQSLTEEETAAIRNVIASAGGTLKYDPDGQPLGIDLVSGRSSADAEAFATVLTCPNLKSLKIRAEQIPNDELAKIAQLAVLEELMLQDAPINDAVLEALAASLPSLQRLTIRNALQVTDVGIKELSVAKALTHLVLIDLQITGSAIPAIAALPSLVSLDLRMCNSISADALGPLAEAANLKELKLGGYGIDDGTLKTIATLPYLESVTIEDASIGTEGIASLVAAEHLRERLRVLAVARCSGLNDESLAQLSAFDGLRRLTIRDVPTTGSFLSELKSGTELELLALNQTYLSDDVFETIAGFKNLKRLEVAQNFLTPDAIEKIGALLALEYLNLSECGISDESLLSLKGLGNLKTLIVEGNPEVSEEAVRQLLSQTQED
jgi:Leucine-rich repeat (LRR) protein